MIPTINKNSNVDDKVIAESLKKAMKGFGSDKNKIINSLCTIPNEKVKN